MLYQEYEDVSAFFNVIAQQDSSVVLDLSCGTGLMTRKLVSLHFKSSVTSAYCTEYAPSFLMLSSAVRTTSHI
jgi:phospholipid N-methyltransferase